MPPIFIFRFSCFKSLFWSTLDGFWIISANDSLFYPIVILGPVYILVGPWALGYFVKDSIGVLFFWGLYVEQRLLPATIAAVYVLFFLVPYIYIFILYAAVISANPHMSQSLLSKIFVVVFLALQFYHTFQVYQKIGFLEIFGVLGIFRISYFTFTFWKVNKLSINYVNWNVSMFNALF